MNLLSIVSDLASFGAAGLMGAMWLWERKLSRCRERQLSESHGRIIRDEERLRNLRKVVQQNTAAIVRFHETQREVREVLKHLHEEFHNDRTN
ncbi:MAG: hypothetical protein SVT52_02765 [Planctomycetota bacterium]|nr:hypothetical protein [Planctomycetota bacterium]